MAHKIVEESFGQKRLEWSKILIAQPQMRLPTMSQLASYMLEPTREALQETANWLEQVLVTAALENANLVVMPELSVPERCLSHIRRWSQRHPDAVVVAGSHYHLGQPASLDSEECSFLNRRSGDVLVARCPIICQGEIRYTYKRNPAPDEDGVVFRGTIRLSGWPEQRILSGTPVGRLGVEICSDFLREEGREVLSHSLDVMCLIALQRDSAHHYEQLQSASAMTPDTYFVYCNGLQRAPSRVTKVVRTGDQDLSRFLTDGGSTVFGHLNRRREAHFGGQEAGYRYQLRPATESEPLMLVQANLAAKRPPAIRVIGDQVNLKRLDLTSTQRSGGQADPWIRAVAFDLDGVLLEYLGHGAKQSSWDCVYNNLRLDRAETRSNRDEFEREEISYQEWVRRDEDRFRRTRLSVRKLAAWSKSGVRLVPEVEGVLRSLKAKGLKLAIISDGLDWFLFDKIPDARALFDYIYINEMFFTSDGLFASCKPTQFGYSRKSAGLDELCSCLSLAREEVAYLGNSRDNDGLVLRRAGFSIGVNYDDSRATWLHANLTRERMADLLSLLSPRIRVDDTDSRPRIAQKRADCVSWDDLSWWVEASSGNQEYRDTVAALLRGNGAHLHRMFVLPANQILRDHAKLLGVLLEQERQGHGWAVVVEDFLEEGARSLTSVAELRDFALIDAGSCAYVFRERVGVESRARELEWLFGDSENWPYIDAMKRSHLALLPECWIASSSFIQDAENSARLADSWGKVRDSGKKFNREINNVLGEGVTNGEWVGWVVSTPDELASLLEKAINVLRRYRDALRNKGRWFPEDY